MGYVAGDLYVSKNGGVDSFSQYVIFVIYAFLYGARGIFFCTVSAFLYEHRSLRWGEETGY